MHCVSISASIDIYIKFRILKNTLSYKQSCINFKNMHFVTFDTVIFENVLSTMMKRIKFNCSFISYMLLSIQHNI